MVEMMSIIYFLNEMMKHIETYLRVLNNIETGPDRLNKGSRGIFLYVLSRFLIRILVTCSEWFKSKYGKCYDRDTNATAQPIIDYAHL